MPKFEITFKITHELSVSFSVDEHDGYLGDGSDEDVTLMARTLAARESFDRGLLPFLTSKTLAQRIQERKDTGIESCNAIGLVHSVKNQKSKILVIGEPGSILTQYGVVIYEEGIKHKYSAITEDMLQHAKTANVYYFERPMKAVVQVRDGRGVKVVRVERLEDV